MRDETIKTTLLITIIFIVINYLVSPDYGKYEKIARMQRSKNFEKDMMEMDRKYRQQQFRRICIRAGVFAIASYVILEKVINQKKQPSTIPGTSEEDREPSVNSRFFR